MPRRPAATRPRAHAYLTDVQRRILQLLCCLVPDVPLPLAIVRGIITIDSLTGGPTDALGTNLRLAPSAAEAALYTVEQLLNDAAPAPVVILNRAQEIITVTAEGHRRAASQLAASPLTDQACARQRINIDGMGPMLLVEIANQLGYLPGHTPIPHAQLGWLATHLCAVYAAERAEAPRGNVGHAYGLVALWRLRRHDAIAPDVLLAQTRQFVPILETFAPAWDSGSTVMELVEVLEAMVETEPAAAREVGPRLHRLAAALIAANPAEAWDGLPLSLTQLGAQIAALA